jgi:hypothetical protein
MFLPKRDSADDGTGLVGIIRFDELVVVIICKFPLLKFAFSTSFSNK